MNAGYSDRPLTEKLGYKSGERIVTYGAPEWFGVQMIENGIVLSETSPAQWLHGFFTTK